MASPMQAPSLAVSPEDDSDQPSTEPEAQWLPFEADFFAPTDALEPAWKRTRALFDEDFYLAVYPDVAGADETPFSHYISKGWREGRNPSATFDTRDYLRRHPDVRATGICPLKHFAEHGQAEGRKISPAAIAEPGLQRALDLFDEDFYLKVYPDVAEADENPFAHYISKGWREGRNPSARFDTRDYLRRNPDVRAAGICPLKHYAEHGQAEGRKISPAAITEPQLHRLLDHFDESFYLASNPDVAQAGIDPFLHYVRTGWREGRNPSPHFDTRFYLQSNPSVAAGGECPLKHYALIGARAGRLARGPIDVKLLTLDNAKSNRERDATRSQLTERSSVEVEELFARLVRGRSTVVVAISHDDYAENVGGVQNVVSDEQRALNAADIGYLHLSPAKPLSGVSWASDADSFETSVRLDGTKLGGFPISEIIREFRRGTALCVERYLIVHHLAGFRPEDVADLALAIAPRETIFWAHDFFHLCANPTLMRNDVAFCSAPPGDSKACEICVYGRERRQMQPRIAKLFDAVRPTMLFPSEGMQSFWRDNARLTFAGEYVAPLGRFEPVAGPARLRTGICCGSDSWARRPITRDGAYSANLPRSARATPGTASFISEGAFPPLVRT